MSDVKRFDPKNFKHTSLFMIGILTVLSGIIASIFPFFLLNESQILYLSSTAAQVTAGVYGLTVTGFLFYRTELSREAAEDESLVELIDLSSPICIRYF